MHHTLAKYNIQVATLGVSSKSHSITLSGWQNEGSRICDRNSESHDQVSTVTPCLQCLIQCNLCRTMC